MENEGFFKKYLDNNGNIKDFDKQLTDSWGEWRNRRKSNEMER